MPNNSVKGEGNIILEPGADKLTAPSPRWVGIDEYWLQLAYNNSL